MDTSNWAIGITIITVLIIVFIFLYSMYRRVKDEMAAEKKYEEVKLNKKLAKDLNSAIMDLPVEYSHLRGPDVKQMFKFNEDVLDRKEND